MNKWSRDLTKEVATKKTWLRLKETIERRNACHDIILMSRHQKDMKDVATPQIATPEGYEGCRDTTLRSRPRIVYEATREVFAKEKRLQLVFNNRFISCRDINLMSRHKNKSVQSATENSFKKGRNL